MPVEELATNCSAAKPLARVCEPGAPFGAASALDATMVPLPLTRALARVML
jgi:hypothetical protein